MDDGLRFDDRLVTVLAQPVASPHDRAVRWRQLVDLVARSGGQGDRALLEDAIAIIRRDGRGIREPLRAAAARAIAGQQVPVAVLTVFAADKLAVAAPLLAPAALEGETLEAVRDAASPDVRRFLDNLHPPAESPAPPAPPALAPAAPPEAPASIGEMVARIERVRTERERPRPPEPPLPAASVFRWECGPEGQIDWVEGAPRGPLIGRSIATADRDEGVDDCVERAFTVRAPFRDCVLEMGDDGELAGPWTISGAPAFAASGGRFIGYRGVARRGLPDAEPAPRDVPDEGNGHDALREMIHEIKTPLNAIIGFAEIIDGQYFGPAHRRYRERAAEIVSNARALLQAAEDLDFVARLQSGRDHGGEGTDFATFFPPFADGLLARAAAAGVTIDLDVPDTGGRCTVDPTLAERLLSRFTDALLKACQPGERLVVHVHSHDRRCAMSVTRPRSTILATRDDLLDPEFTIGEADRGLLGLGFSMRLVNGLASLAGGGLEISDDHLTLFVPLHT